jgi:hypothetical protein
MHILCMDFQMEWQAIYTARSFTKKYWKLPLLKNIEHFSSYFYEEKPIINQDCE